MKVLLLILVASLFSLTACNKTNATDASLMGVWVDKNYPLDTLVVYREDGKNMMFDNSLAFRQSYATNPNAKNSVLHQYILTKGSIGLKWGNASRRDPYMFGSFRWINYKEEFNMSYN